MYPPDLSVILINCNTTRIMSLFLYLILILWAYNGLLVIDWLRKNRRTNCHWSTLLPTSEESIVYGQMNSQIYLDWL